MELKDSQRFAEWVEALEDWRIVRVRTSYRDRFGNPAYKMEDRVSGSSMGIDLPAPEELERALTAPCRFRALLDKRT
jgi:hypothetical protein